MKADDRGEQASLMEPLLIGEGSRNMNAIQSRFQENIQICDDWKSITEQFAQFPNPSLWRDEEGDGHRDEWVFRGHKNSDFGLEPSIERAHRNEWAEAEYRVLREFQSKASMHMDPALVPPLNDRLRWLAIIQHYGAPTRLLDFTYSPYIALYFALRNRSKEETTSAEIWCLNAALVRDQAEKVSFQADEEVRDGLLGPKPHRSVKGLLNPRNAFSSLQSTTVEEANWSDLINKALDPCSVRRQYFNDKGFIAIASPPIQIPRFSSQQGVFLFNGAEGLTFEASLETIMSDANAQWYKRFRIPAAALINFERQLFQFNIHELSLFPDIEGLAGFIRQKIRLHW